MSEPSPESDRAALPQEVHQLGLGLSETAEISLEELGNTPEARLVDVRSPSEFDRDHIPGAVSVPLFDDRERAVVGTLYRWQGAQSAQGWGGERVAARLASYTRKLVEVLALDPESLRDQRPRVITCARGGQRSGAVTEYLRSLGHPVRRLMGGHRSYRAWVREQLSTTKIPRPIVLNGLTGCGKTHVLRHIQARFPSRVVDLEGLAGHRSSVLGDIGLVPAGQKQFEASLAQALGSLDPQWSLFEWEARRIGNREIPANVFAQLKDAPQIELCATLEQRVETLANDYLECGGVAEVRARLPLLADFPSIGPDGVRRLDEWLDAGRIHEVVEFLLAHHYDPRYQHGNQHLTFVHKIDLRSYEETGDEIIAWIETEGEAALNRGGHDSGKTSPPVRGGS